MNAPQERCGVAGKFTSRMRRVDRKRQILQHAKLLFVSLGYQHTTTDKIAKAAGVTEPVLYRHFANKKQLFIEVLSEVRQAAVQRWQEATERLSDPAARLQTIVDLYVGCTREQAVDLRVMHRTLVEVDDLEIGNCLREFYLDTERLLSSIIREGQETGVFRPNIEPRVVAWEFIRNAMAFSLTLPLGVPLYQEENYLPRAIECMMTCLLKRI